MNLQSLDNLLYSLPNLVKVTYIYKDNFKNFFLQLINIKIIIVNQGTNQIVHKISMGWGKRADGGKMNKNKLEYSGYILIANIYSGKTLRYFYKTLTILRLPNTTNIFISNIK